MDPQESSTPSFPEQLLPKINEAFRLLAEMEILVRQFSAVPTQAQQHLATATRELAALQGIFERRGTR